MVRNFKQCPCCGKEWRFQSDFLVDQELDFQGYQSVFNSNKPGAYLFTHIANNCFSTISVSENEFINLYLHFIYPGYDIGFSALYPEHQKNFIDGSNDNWICACEFVHDVITYLIELRGH